MVMNVIQKTNWKILPLSLREKKFRSLSKSVVDGEEWHTIQCKPEVSAWIRSQPDENSIWFQNISDSWMTNANVFDVHNKIYTLILLKWQ